MDEVGAKAEAIVERLGTGPVPAYPYYRQDYFDLEVAAVFRRTWLQVGHVCELPEPGTYMVRPLEFAKTTLLITRGPDGVIRAFHNVCTHRGTQLVFDEGGRKTSFTCLYHAWTFNHDGQLRSAPDFERFYTEKSKCGLPPVAVDVCAGLIFVNLDPRPKQGLRDFLGRYAEELETLPVARATNFSEYVYEVDANWKLTYDNFQENYHLRFIHPRSGGAAVGEGNQFGYPVAYNFNGPHRGQTIWVNTKAAPTPFQAFAFGKQAGFAVADGFAGGARNKEYYGIFPNFFLLGSATQPFSQCVMPVAADRTRCVIRLYWIGEDRCASQRVGREYAMALARDIHCEDRAVIEAGHRGLSSGAIEHIHFQSQEVLCRHLFNTIDAMVEDYKSGRAAAGGAT
jgi:phenylpropionate dioxygenase-like ring-hydroxylating dioxygenase large terminal subunit